MTCDVLRFDILVVGAGPAGLAAAVHAAERGVRVGLVDQQPARGGQIWRRHLDEVSPAARPWLERLERLERLEQLEGTGTGGVTWLPGTAIVDAPDTSTLIGVRPPTQPDSGPVRLHARRLILATGARERYLPFPGSTHPSVTAAGGLQALVKGGLPIAGQRVLIAGSGPLLLAVAAYLRGQGAEIAAIVEQASRARLARFALHLATWPAKWLQLAALQARLRGVRRIYGAWPTAVLERPGTTHAGLEVHLGRAGKMDTSLGANSGASRFVNRLAIDRLAIDRLAIGVGLLPETRLASLLGCRVQEELGVWVDGEQRTSHTHVLCAGEPTGIGGVDKALIEGEIAGRVAAADVLGHPLSIAPSLRRRRDRARRFARALEDAFRLCPKLRALPTADSVVCRCEDVTWGRLAELTDPRAAKLLTRCGMGACQGRMCADALSFLHGAATSERIPSTRPPLQPLTVGELACAWSAPVPSPKHLETRP